MTTTTIPAGYRFTVTTWENDADNYNTEVVEGVSLDTAKFYAALCNEFSWWDGQRDERLSNIWEPSDKDMTRLAAFSRKLFADHPAELEAQLEVDQSVLGDDDAAVDCLLEVLGVLGISGSTFFTRVVSEWKVEFVPVPIELKDVTAEFV